MNMKQFRYVLVLAKEGSFSRAADVLGISQPSLSQYIKKIEQEVGATLFDRVKGDVRITDAGRVYIEAGKTILDVEHRMEVQLLDISSGKAGSLIVGTTPYRAVGLMPSVTKAFQELHPGMHLVVREGTTSELVEGLERLRFDLCLTLLPVDGNLFSYEKVFEEEQVLAVPAGFPAFDTVTVPNRKFPAVDVKQLNDLRFVMLTDTQYMQRQLENLVRDHHLHVGIAAVVKSLEAQIAMVRSDVGVALVPSDIERFCGPSEIKFYSFIQELPQRQVAIVWRKVEKLSGVVEELKDVIRHVF